MNAELYVRDPEGTELGRNIIKHSILMIQELGFEEFTFRKLAIRVNTTEASVYRYFENKHRLLTYIIAWFWTWTEYQLIFHTNNVNNAKNKIEIIIGLLTFKAEDQFILDHIDKNMLQQIVIAEGNKSYLTKHVNEDNKALIFKPYKDLCHRIAEIFLEYRPGFEYPHSLASTLVETVHHQLFFKEHLPRLTDFRSDNKDDALAQFLGQLVFRVLDGEKK